MIRGVGQCRAGLPTQDLFCYERSYAPDRSATVNALTKEGASAVAREPAHIAAQRRELGRRLATARSEAGLTQQDLARALYYERTSVAHIEGGRQPAPRSFGSGPTRYSLPGERCLRATTT